MNNKITSYILIASKLRTVIALVIVVLFFSIKVDNYLTLGNLLTMGQHITLLALLAIGMTFAIISAGIDLSVGSFVGFSGMLAGFLLTQGIKIGEDKIIFFNAFSSIIIVLLISVVVGCITGLIITQLKIPPFIATLGMLYILRSSALLMSNGATFPELEGIEELGNTGFPLLGVGEFLFIPILIWILCILLLVSIYIAYKTPLGRYIYAIGGNEKAAVLSGIPVNYVKIFIYGFSGFCAALAGLITVSLLGASHPNVGNLQELDAIAAVVLGGAALNGGKGGLLSSLVGACVIIALGDGLIMLGISSFWQMAVKGVVIIAAVSINQLQQKISSSIVQTKQ